MWGGGGGVCLCVVVVPVESYNIRQNHYNVAHIQFHLRIYAGYAQTISQYALV